MFSEPEYCSEFCTASLKFVFDHKPTGRKAQPNPRARDFLSAVPFSFATPIFAFFVTCFERQSSGESGSLWVLLSSPLNFIFLASSLVYRLARYTAETRYFKRKTFELIKPCSEIWPTTLTNLTKHGFLEHSLPLLP